MLTVLALVFSAVASVVLVSLVVKAEVVVDCLFLSYYGYYYCCCFLKLLRGTAGFLVYYWFKVLGDSSYLARGLFAVMFSEVIRRC